ncbi:MAG: tetratricopeptide repeat protein [Flavobacteriaceae bacterium]|nr:tetratricopeptide repeat protein [Flavobacteriaceae bacterium]
MRSKIFILLYFISAMVFAQQNDASNQRKARTLLRDGNELYNQKKYADAEVAYKKALEKNSSYSKAVYNLGNALYQQNRNEESVQLFETIALNSKDKLVKAEAFHNLGNSFMKAKKYGPAVEAYKNALRNNSLDEETRYNLALAQKLLKEQEQNKDQDKKDQNQKDQNQDNQDKKENQDKKDDQQDQKDQNQDKKDKDKKDNQQQQPQPNKLSQQQIEQLLEAMNKEENKTQKKVNAQKVPNQSNKKEKDW